VFTTEQTLAFVAATMGGGWKPDRMSLLFHF